MKSDEAKRLRELEVENQRLKEIACRSRVRQTHSEDGLGGKLLSPARRRDAVNYVQEKCEVSQRRACRTFDQSLSAQRYRTSSEGR